MPSAPPPRLPPPGLILTSGPPSWLLPAHAAGGRSRVRGAARRATRLDSTAARLARRDRLGPLALVGGPEGRGRSARRGIMGCGSSLYGFGSRRAVVLPLPARKPHTVVAR